MFIDKNQFRFGYYLGTITLRVHRSSMCLHHSPFRKPLSDSIFLPFLPPFCPPFIHFTSEACRGISGSVKRFGSIASSFHLRYHPPLFVILVRKSNIVSPIFSCPFLKLYYTLVLFLSAISFVLFNHSVNLPFRRLASNPFLLFSSSLSASLSSLLSLSHSLTL